LQFKTEQQDVEVMGVIFELKAVEEAVVVVVQEDEQERVILRPHQVQLPTLTREATTAVSFCSCSHSSRGTI